jgi:hypothetical protein
VNESHNRALVYENPPKKKSGCAALARRNRSLAVGKGRAKAPLKCCRAAGCTGTARACVSMGKMSKQSLLRSHPCCCALLTELTVRSRLCSQKKCTTGIIGAKPSAFVASYAALPAEGRTCSAVLPGNLQFWVRYTAALSRPYTGSRTASYTVCTHAESENGNEKVVCLRLPTERKSRQNARLGLGAQAGSFARDSASGAARCSRSGTYKRHISAGKRPTAAPLEEFDA